ncbi:unnamed protein product [Diatraea saccharalis]|uniref:Peroxidase n=1 Tax=Diatraea saccharalis TaxID=40085 RepID=A0A9N9RGJ5_9NEOP|nr:unnamed protein product [Diatraea saccharalis]
MRAFVVCVLLFIHCAYAQVLYDAFFGKPLKTDRRNFLNSINATSSCTILVEPCKKHEGRRVDGTCANPKYPSRGGTRTPLLRMLPASYGLGNTLRTSLNGSELPSTRLLRTKLLSDGYPTDHNFNSLGAHLGVFSFIDSVDLNVLFRFILVSDCCIGNTPNRVNPLCISIPVAADDPYLRRTGIRCMNLTRQDTFQERGCVSNTIPAERYNLPTPLLDLSVVYGFTNERERQIREYKDGLLKSEKRNGLDYPPGNGTICDEIGANLLPGIYLSAMWFFRKHNHLARELAEINPCWTDQELFETARYINIAEWQHMFYYEIMAEFLGRKNALSTGIIHDTQGYVNDFDEHYEPGVYHEYVVGSRWFHTFQDGRMDLYSNKGEYLGTRPASDNGLRSGVLEVNNTEADLTQGAFRQPSHKFDYVIEPDMAERVAGDLQTALDVSAADISRGRDQGLPPYNQYRKLCGLPYAHKFEDFHDVIFPDKVEQMRRIYNDVNDVDLMAAIYSEKLIDGGFVGPTLFCIIVQNMLQWRKSDRHFFEHGDTPTALTLPQLNEIRKSSTARLLCDNGDRVHEIQPRAILNPGPGNEIRSCKEIPSVDLTKWTDDRCFHKDDKQNREEYTQHQNTAYQLWESYNYDKK